MGYHRQAGAEGLWRLRLLHLQCCHRQQRAQLLRSGGGSEAAGEPEHRVWCEPSGSDRKNRHKRPFHPHLPGGQQAHREKNEVVLQAHVVERPLPRLGRRPRGTLRHHGHRRGYRGKVSAGRVELQPRRGWIQNDAAAAKFGIVSRSGSRIRTATTTPLPLACRTCSRIMR